MLIYYTQFFSIIYYYLKHNILFSLFYGVCAQFCKGLRTPILHLCKAVQVWLAIVNLRTYEHHDLARRMPVCRKTYRMTIRQHVLLFSRYYTHEFHYYAHYFQCLGRIHLGKKRDIHAAAQCTVAAAVVWERDQAKGWTGKLLSLSEVHCRCCFEAIIHIIRLLRELF